MVITSIIKLIFVLGLIYGIHKIGIFKKIENISNKLIKTNESYQKERKSKNKYLKKLFKSNKYDNEV